MYVHAIWGTQVHQTSALLASAAGGVRFIVIYSYIHTYIYIYIYTYLYMHTYIFTYIRIHADTYTYMHTIGGTRVKTIRTPWLRGSGRQVHCSVMLIHTYIHAYIQIHTHTCIPLGVPE